MSYEDQANVVDRYQEHVKTLNDLISTCRDSEEGFGKAAKGVRSDYLREQLMKIVQARHDFVDQLTDMVRRLGAEPAERGHGGGVLHRGWVDLEQRTRPADDQRLLTECGRGEETTVNHYAHALEQNLPEDIQQVLRTHLAAIQETIDNVRELAVSANR
jgi:uncharacterized protein (TIGR02284 family)